MALLVTMHVYSGMPDPQWIISDDVERELRSIMAPPLPRESFRNSCLDSAIVVSQCWKRQVEWSPLQCS
jgi:hypothetical protein